MELNVQVETTSPIQRKLKISVPAKTVEERFEKSLVEVQRGARMNGFRQGMVPLSMVRQVYGKDVRHRLFHDLIEDAYRQALQEKNIRAVGSPQIETPEHKTGHGEHDHDLEVGKDLHFTATVEVLPEIQAKAYTGIALTEESSAVEAGDVDKLIDRLRDSQGQLVPVGGGLVGADGQSTGRGAKMGDFAEAEFKGGLVTEKGVEHRKEMSGSRLIELGGGELIPGFEEQMVGMRSGETKTFRIHFPKDYGAAEMAGKEAEFTVTVRELKEKKLPELDEEFAKTVGYESLADMRKQATEHLEREKKAESERKVKSDLLAALIEKNPFDVPASLIQAQTRVLAQDVAGNLRNQGFNDTMIQEALSGELENLKKRAESQVRASLLLESVAKAEGISVSAEEVEAEIAKMAASSNMPLDKVQEFYSSNASRRADLEFRMREDRTLGFLLEKSKLKKSK